MQELEIRNIREKSTVSLGYGNQRTFTAELLCPRCGTFSEVFGVAAPGRPQIAYVCRRCREMTMVEVATMSHPEHVTEYHPKRKLTVDPSVDKNMASDYLEAQRCFSVGAWRACAVMARRFVHSVMAEKEAEGANLYAQIKDLKEKRVLTPSLAEASQQVRVLGKYGAHPFELSETGLEQMEEGDAQAALDFCKMLIEYVYVLESKLDASRAAVETKRKAAADSSSPSGGS